jgi:hypothetical protein
MAKHLNIISFNVPYPPNYGGIIDVYYKIKALNDLGVKITLHCFDYEHRADKSSALENICEQVIYYPRVTGAMANLSSLPYNVKSRTASTLLDNLLKNDYPILFEGLHTCYFAQNKRLVNRVKICRMTNIEHDYYWYLAKAEHNIIKKVFFSIEGLKFQRYQHILNDIDFILTVSESDQSYYLQRYSNSKVLFIPCFHANENITSTLGHSDYILYHAKLSVPENLKAAEYLIKNVFSKLDYRCVIAGMNPPHSLLKLAGKYHNIEIIANPNDVEMNDLIQNAQVNVLITFQATGMKLKLLNALFSGRHILVNSLMVQGTGVGSICHIADTPDELIEKCNQLIHSNFTKKDKESRESVLFPAFSNKYQAQRIIELLP